MFCTTIGARPSDNSSAIKTFGKLSKEVLADAAAKDPLTRKVYDSYTAFLAGMMDWTELSERGYVFADSGFTRSAIVALSAVFRTTR